MFFYLITISSVLGLLIILNLIFIKNYTQLTNDKTKLLSDSIYLSKKEYIKDLIDRTIQDIEIERSQLLQTTDNLSVDEAVKTNIINRIRQERFIDDGYICINEIINYEGGDDYAIRLVHPNLPETEGTFLSTNTEDIFGKKPYKIELDGINNDGELYYDYYFKKMDSELIAHKLSYAKLYKPYN